MAFNHSGQQFGQYGQYGAGQFGSPNELGNVLSAVMQATLPVILGSLRGPYQGAVGMPFGQPAFHGQGQWAQGQWGGAPDLSQLLGPVLQATVPVILNSLRGQQQGWPGGQGFGAIGVPGFQSQQGPFGGPQIGQFGQADLGNVIGPVLQATLPAILGSLQQAGPGMAGWRH